MANSQPNIVFIIADHQAFYGHDRAGEYEYKWENFERFASEGARFNRAYSVCPLCSPARSSMMTGVYPSSHGIIMNTEAAMFGNQADLDSGQQLYSHYLSQAGYRNGYVGKWHCGRERLPVDYGIEGWSLPDYGKIYMSDAYKSYAEERGLGDARALIEYNINYPDWRGQEIVLHDPSPWKFMNGSGVLAGPPEAHEEQFVAHLACEKLREFAKSDQPFSLVVSLWGPHQPYYPSAEYADRLTRPRSRNTPASATTWPGVPCGTFSTAKSRTAARSPLPNGRLGKRSSPAATRRVIRLTPRSATCWIRWMNSP